MRLRIGRQPDWWRAGADTPSAGNPDAPKETLPDDVIYPCPGSRTTPGGLLPPRCPCFFPVLRGPGVKRRNLPRNGMQPGRRSSALRRAHRPTSRFRQTRLGPPSQIRLGGGSFHTHRRHRPRRVPSLSEASVAAHVKSVVQSRHCTFGDKRTERRPRRGLARQLTGNVPNVLFPIHHRPTSSAQ